MVDHRHRSKSCTVNGKLKWENDKKYYKLDHKD